MRADGVPSFAVPCARPSMIDMLIGLPVAIDAVCVPWPCESLGKN
jgi:hypothetical protein